MFSHAASLITVHADVYEYYYGLSQAEENPRTVTVPAFNTAAQSSQTVQYTS